MKCIVTGRVQGVYYRGSIQKQALTLGVIGQAINLPNGSVEVTMCGEQTVLDSLQDLLWHGSKFSEVLSVVCELTILQTTPTTFTTG